LNLHAGIRFKFFEFRKGEQYNYFSIAMNGYAYPDVASSTPSKLLHRSGIKKSDYSYFMGLSYDIPLRKKQKLKAE
jgi:hypothetical protein